MLRARSKGVAVVSFRAHHDFSNCSGGAMMVPVSALFSRSSAANNLPINSGVSLGADAVLFFGFVGWGVGFRRLKDFITALP